MNREDKKKTNRQTTNSLNQIVPNDLHDHKNRQTCVQKSEGGWVVVFENGNQSKKTEREMN